MMIKEEKMLEFIRATAEDLEDVKSKQKHTFFGS